MTGLPLSLHCVNTLDFGISSIKIIDSRKITFDVRVKCHWLAVESRIRGSRIMSGCDRSVSSSKVESDHYEIYDHDRSFWQLTSPCKRDDLLREEERECGRVISPQGLGFRVLEWKTTSSVMKIALHDICIYIFRMFLQGLHVRAGTCELYKERLS